MAVASNIREGRGESNAFLRGACELSSDWPFWLLNRRRSNDENPGNRHPWLDRRSADCVNQRGHSLRRVPCMMGMHRLKVVGAQHEDDHIERRVDLDTLFKSHQPVSAGLERIVKRCAATVETVFNDAHVVAIPAQR